MTSDAEIRRAVTLSCADALRFTSPITSEQADAVAWVLGRLASTRPLSTLDEADLLNSLTETGCVMAPPFERVVA